MYMCVSSDIMMGNRWFVFFILGGGGGVGLPYVAFFSFVFSLCVCSITCVQKHKQFISTNTSTISL